MSDRILTPGIEPWDYVPHAKTFWPADKPWPRICCGWPRAFPELMAKAREDLGILTAKERARKINKIDLEYIDARCRARRAVWHRLWQCCGKEIGPIY